MRVASLFILSVLLILVLPKAELLCFIYLKQKTVIYTPVKDILWNN